MPETYKAKNAVENGVYMCNKCNAKFRLTAVGDLDFPSHYDINCPLCGHFPRK